MSGRLRDWQSSLIFESTIASPLSALVFVLDRLCHFRILSTVARVAGSRDLPWKSRPVRPISVVRPMSWSASVIGDPTRTRLFFSCRSIAFHSGPASAGALVAYPHLEQNCSPFSVSPSSLFPQTGHDVVKASSPLAFQRVSPFTLPRRPRRRPFRFCRS